MKYLFLLVLAGCATTPEPPTTIPIEASEKVWVGYERAEFDGCSDDLALITFFWYEAEYFETHSFCTRDFKLKGEGE